MILSSIGMVSCSSCVSSNSTPDSSSSSTSSVTAEPIVQPTSTFTGDAGPPPTPTNTVVAKENWSFTLPNVWVNEGTECSPERCVVLFSSADETNVVVFVRESFGGTYDEFVIQTIRELKGAGATILSTMEAEINGHNFVLISSVKDSIMAEVWVTVEDNTAYSFACAGLNDIHVCTTIATSLVIQ